jgi:hypothetical protein
MSFRSASTFVSLWRESWFFRANVVLSAMGMLYLLTR